MTIIKADTFWKRLVGLLGRSGLENDKAFLIPNCAGVHTYFMRFPIDIVFVDRKTKDIKKVYENVKPFRVAFGPIGCDVYEMAVGQGRDFRP